MKFNNKWDVLPDKEVNNRQRKGRFILFRQEGDSNQPGKCGELVCIERGRHAQGGSKVKESEGWKGRR